MSVDRQIELGPISESKEPNQFPFREGIQIKSPGVAVIITLLLLAVGVIVVYPALVLLGSAFSWAGQPSLEAIQRVLQAEENWHALGNSLWVCTWATLGATALGIVLAWLIARTNIPMRPLLRLLLLIPYLIPPFVGALAWIYLIGPVGFLTKMYMGLSGLTAPPFRIYGPGGIIWVMLLYGFPIPYLASMTAFERLDVSFEEAARASGAGILRTLRDITLPLLLPSIGAGALLLWISLLANFGIPQIIGFPARYFVLPTRIYGTVVSSAGENNLQLAAALAILLAFTSAPALWVYWHLARRPRSGSASGLRVVAPVRLGKARWPAFAFALLVALIAGILPVAAVMLTSIIRAPGVPLVPENLTLNNYGTLATIDGAWRSLRNSAGLAAGAATLVTLLAIGMSYILVRWRPRGGGLLDTLITLPYAVPGTIVALAMILAWLRPILGIRLYDTVWILFLAYVARFLAVGVRTASAALEQLPISLEEAARASGAGALRAFLDVTLPMLRPALLVAWFLVAIPALTELTMSTLLASVGNETLGQFAFALHEEGKAALTAALATILVSVSLAANWLVRTISKGEIGF